MKKPIFIISGPSGVGEDTIISELKKELPLDKIVTTTTRDKREGEEEGIAYYFITDSQFDEMLANQNFFEHATQQNGKKYGVTHKEINRVKNGNNIAIWKIEWQGVKKAKELLKDEVVAILITAPLDVLQKRIRDRGGLTEEQIKERMAYSKEWLNHTDLYDYQVPNLNGKLQQAVTAVKQIIKKHS